jgi:hypothetical protein
MVQRATLTYLDRTGQPVVTFELDCPTTIVGRAPLGVGDLPDDGGLRQQTTYQVRQGDALFAGIASDLAMCRRHFCIRRAIAASGEAVYSIQDLNSRCGTFVNDAVIRAVMQLKDGDSIRCSSRFVFNLAPNNNDPVTIQAEQSVPPDGAGQSGSPQA